MGMETQQRAQAGPLSKGPTRGEGNRSNRETSGRTNGI